MRVQQQVGSILHYGLGTAWYKASGDKAVSMTDAMKMALTEGMRGLDNAQMYCNEMHVGPALADFLSGSSIERKDLFITSKVSAGSDPVEEARRSLRELGLSYLDLFLIHAPFDQTQALGKVWERMEQCVKEGLTKSIGVSNFRPADIEEILAVATIAPVCNQIELHPYCLDEPLLRVCKQHDITVVSYAGLLPLTKQPDGPVSAVVKRMAEQHSVSEAAVLQAWLRGLGAGVVTTSSKRERIAELLAAWDSLKLSAEEIAEITQTGKKYFFRNHWTAKFLDYDEGRGVTNKKK